MCSWRIQQSKPIDERGKSRLLWPRNARQHEHGQKGRGFSWARTRLDRLRGASASNDIVFLFLCVCGITELGLDIIDSYDALLPLHRLWLGYMSELLSVSLRGATQAPFSTPGPSSSVRADQSGVAVHRREVRTAAQEGFQQSTVVNWQSKLVKADFLGCILRGWDILSSLLFVLVSVTDMVLLVSKSRNPSLVGVGGIVLQETAETWRVVTTDDALKSESRREPRVVKAPLSFFMLPLNTFFFPRAIKNQSSRNGIRFSCLALRWKKTGGRGSWSLRSLEIQWRCVQRRG
jgi:hypothetical protein